MSVPGTGSSVQRDTRVLGCGSSGVKRTQEDDLGWSRDQSAKEVGQEWDNGGRQEALRILNAGVMEIRLSLS